MSLPNTGTQEVRQPGRRSLKPAPTRMRKQSIDKNHGPDRSEGIRQCWQERSSAAMSDKRKGWGSVPGQDLPDNGADKLRIDGPAPSQRRAKIDDNGIPTVRRTQRFESKPSRRAGQRAVNEHASRIHAVEEVRIVL